MKRSRGNIKRYIESSDSDDNRPLKKSPPNIEKPEQNKSHGSSSSESDIENYLQRPDKLNLDSEFFNMIKYDVSKFENIEKNVFSGVRQLSDTSESENEDESRISKKEKRKPGSFLKVKLENSASSKITFDQLQDYTKKIEEAKKHIEIYRAKKQAEENKIDILNLLAAGERKIAIEQKLTPADLHSSDFESCESDQEDWEEIRMKAIQENSEKNIVPQRGLQITLDMSDNVKKKKGVDLLAAMKRRLNRIRKENQLLVHKVHLLCWMAHGNYINSAINDNQTLAMALSLLPSEQCYPLERTDLTYLEQILNWYKRTVRNIEKPVPKEMPFDKCLQVQINRKEAYNKKMLVCIFVAILRSLGIQCRIVMSLQVEPLRPPASELHSVSTKDDTTNKQQKATSGKTKSRTGTSNRTNGIVPSTSKQDESIASTSKVNLLKLKRNNTKQEKLSGSQVEFYTKHCHIKKETNKNVKRESNAKIKTNSKNQTKYDKTSEKKCTAKTETESTQTNTGKSSRSKRSNEIAILKSSDTRNDKLTSGGGPKEEHLKNKRSTRTNTFEAKKDISIKTKLPVSKELRRSKSTDSNDSKFNIALSVPNNNKRSKSTDASTRSRKSNENKDKLTESKLTTSKTKRLAKSIDSKDLSASNSKNTKAKGSHSISKETKVKISGMPKKKLVKQVDGIFDSDSDKEMIALQLDGANDKTKSAKTTSKPNLRNLKKSSRCHNLDEDDSDSDFESSPSRSFINKKRFGKTSQKPSLKKQLDVKNDIMNLIKGRIKEQKTIDNRRMVKRRKPTPESDSDSDFAPEPVKKKHHDMEDEFVPKTKIKKRIQMPGRSVLSDDDENDKSKKKKGIDTWIEVFLESEEKWISVDIVFGQIHSIKDIYGRATHPVSYVIAWNNNNTLKDVTQRYCVNFNTVTRKLRIDAKWWNQSLKPFLALPTARDKEEDDDLARQQLEQPLPKSISEYKNHPLYALRRHLLKFEAVYPPEPPTLGFIRGEAVYPRRCVFTLHSRDIWLKQAKVVKLGEQPYKIVKARPKYDKLSNKMITDKNLEIFGPWQVQDYEPPTAENGVVPKNAFGNVDLFKACMLPKGTVHLKLPGLNKIARRMNIDCAAAIIGFDFHGGWSHPVYDGFIVCKEYEDQLIFDWELEQEELERKEQEKLDKRVYGNWKKLIRGLLIRERLKIKYDFGKSSGTGGDERKKKCKGPSFCTKKNR